MIEQWESVSGFAEYQISNYGRVKGKRGQLLKPQATWKGYLRVCMHGDSGNKQYRTIHSLVLENFIGARPEGFHGCHKDGNKENNRLCNLKWATPAENYDDKLLHGTDQSGERHGGSKLTESQVMEIRQIYANRTTKHYGESKLAHQYGVSRSAIYRAAIGKNWSSL